MTQNRRRRRESSSSSDEEHLLEHLVEVANRTNNLVAKVRTNMNPKTKIPKCKDFWPRVFNSLLDHKFSVYYRRSRSPFYQLIDFLFPLSNYSVKNKFIKAMAMTIKYVSTRARIVDLN